MNCVVCFDTKQRFSEITMRLSAIIYAEWMCPRWHASLVRAHRSQSSKYSSSLMPLAMKGNRADGMHLESTHMGRERLKRGPLNWNARHWKGNLKNHLCSGAVETYKYALLRSPDMNQSCGCAAWLTSSTLNTWNGKAFGNLLSFLKSKIKLFRA